MLAFQLALATQPAHVQHVRVCGCCELLLHALCLARRCTATHSDIRSHANARRAVLAKKADAVSIEKCIEAKKCEPTVAKGHSSGHRWCKSLPMRAGECWELQ